WKTKAQCEVAGEFVGVPSRPTGHVLLAGRFTAKRPTTNRHVKTAGSNGSKRTGTDGGIVDPRGGRVQRVISQCGGSTVTIAWALCFQRRQKCKAGKGEQREPHINNVGDFFHV